MSVNLVELLQDLLGKDAVSQLGGMLGESTDKTQMALTTAVPSLVGGLVSKASSKSGADELMQAIDHADPGSLPNLAEVLGEHKLESIEAQGSHLLNLIFGSNFNSVLDVLSRSIGLGGKSAGRLLAVLAPIVISVLKQQQSKLGLDADGLVKLLLGQTEFLRGKLPSGLGNLLGLSGVDAMGLAASRSKPPAAHAANVLADKTPTVPPAGDSSPSRLLPLIALLALALIAWQLFSRRPDTRPVINSIAEPLDTESMLAPATGDTELSGPRR